MEVEKRGAKGGFFQLFDWNAKSKKKLFSSKSESVLESSNKGKENYHGSAIARHQPGLENGARGHNDYHYASSASGDSEYETKAPGVVARLMGLDSLPTPSTVNEPHFIESHSFRDASYGRTAPPPFQSEHDIVIFESVRNKLDGLSRNPLDLRLQKVQSRPFERFQSEVLPPKSAKPISITHHRLLSPIKSPGFIPPKNAAYIIEAAAKIIEQSPRSGVNNGRFPNLGSSSLQFRSRDMKEKMEAAQRSSRSKEPSPSRHVNKQVSVRGQGRSKESYLAEESKRVGSQRSKSKENSVSRAVEAKTNIQKKDGVGNRSSDKQKEQNDIKSRNIPNTQKKMEKQSASRRPQEVLRLNHQKQNCASVKDTDNSENSKSNLSNNHIYGRAKKTVNAVNNVVTYRKTNLMVADPGKEFSSSRTKTTVKKKKSVNVDIHSDGSLSERSSVKKNEKSIKCNVAFEGDSKWDTIDKKNSLDVVSFTFTSPIKKSGANVTGSSEFRDSAGSSSGSNVTCRDSLSLLLEQKLKELTSIVELSQPDLSEAGSFASPTNSYGNMGPTVDLVNSSPMNDDICKGKQELQSSSDFPSTDKLWLQVEKESKGLEIMEKDGTNSNINYQRYLYLQGSNPVSSLPSFSGASSDSFDVDKYESSVQGLSLESSYEGMTWQRFARKSHPTEGDADISDTASSLSYGTISETITSSLYMTDSKDSSYWELQYIGDILNNGELMYEEFALGQTHKIIAPNLFDQLENHRKVENFMLERKVLFDCVVECLEVRCGRLLDGSFTVWGKQTRVLRKKQWLAEEMYREISSWVNNEELMVDELVEKDMSCKNGKWIDFEFEAFEEGIEIEDRILNSLVDELIDDFLF
ncbi:hypothetical protein ACJIZ3_000917 [Penstemon smallii]|uniref:DUF4378 domain-containing protein n=1 Tax=Penstemon smallii TaxID=265156 RepID=A0ABD3U289_9LAMI